jgi:hypothetical protein
VSQALLCVPGTFRETSLLQLNLLRAMGLDSALVFVELILMLPVVLLDDPDLLLGQTWDPSDDFIGRVILLEVWYQIVNCNPAGRELQASATVHKSDLVLHTTSSSSLRSRHDNRVYSNRTVAARTERLE